MNIKFVLHISVLLLEKKPKQNKKRRGWHSPFGERRLKPSKNYGIITKNSEIPTLNYRKITNFFNSLFIDLYNYLSHASYQIL